MSKPLQSVFNWDAAPLPAQGAKLDADGHRWWAAQHRVTASIAIANAEKMRAMGFARDAWEIQTALETLEIAKNAAAYHEAQANRLPDLGGAGK